MTTPSPELARRLEVLHAAFRDKLPGRLAELEALWRSWRGCPDAAALEPLHQLAHKLKGSLGTYGFREAGAAAAALEERIERLMEAGGADAADDLAAAADALARLRAACDVVTGAGDTSPHPEG